ncbi:disulfide oxidoreductase [Candidatus Shapirobacteria bacterium CG_4_10_14_3_um_filter_35_13]|uniref:Disulfide oxidoreductase n=1 Tax=Candidatus Shapirobacteria bacterium CG_4_10_14_3_um_filter_35_13 TaxID=1974873 RepID=A0A2M7LIX7_9BACT|nr:MAG: disulfide oxidoreductase [Candidatus Shapirobacteria bacterium CG_4_10_14_3_um_filter_35_13]
MINKKLITKDMLIAQLAEQYPALVDVLIEDYGFHCIGCGMSAIESLEQGASVHGMTNKEIKTMVDNLNELVNAEK